MEIILTSGAVTSEREGSKPLPVQGGVPLGLILCDSSSVQGGVGVGGLGWKEFAELPARRSHSSSVFSFLKRSHMACSDTSPPGKLSS